MALLKKIGGILLMVVIAAALGAAMIVGFVWWDKNYNHSSSSQTEETADDGVVEVPADVAKIQDAVNQAKAGDTIKIAAGTFTDASTTNGISSIIRVDKALTIEGAGRDKTILDGKRKVMFGIFVPEGISGKVVIKDMTIKNFENNSIDALNKTIEVSGTTLSGNGNQGAYFKDSSSSSKFYNNIVADNTFLGLQIEKSAVKIYNNTIANNGTVGISLVVTDTNPKGTSPEIYNNIVTGHSRYGLLYTNPAFPQDAVVDHNNMFANGAAYFEYLNNEQTKKKAVNPTPGTGNVAVDPNYTDDSFKLPANSSLKKASRSGSELGAYGK